MSETGNGRKNWTRVVAAVGLVFLAVAGGIVLANANKVINKTEKKDEETPLISIGFSQVGAESEWRTGNSISIKTTFSQKRGYDLIFKDAQQQQEQQIKAIRGFIQQDVNYIVLAPVVYIVMMSFCEKIEGIEGEMQAQSEELKNSMKTIQTLEEIKNYIRMLLKKIIGVRDTISGRRYSDIIEIAKDQIRKTYMSDEISLNTIAAEVGMSPSYFSSIFSKEMGKTFVEYLTEIRMDRAKELLMCSSMKTSEIGYEVGYKDPHYFSYIFKKTQNCTPKEFRARGKE